MDKLLLSIIICLLIVACTKEIEVEQPVYEPEIVVDGWIENNNFAHVILTHSSPFIQEYDSMSIRNTFLNYAKVTLSDSKGNTEILTLTRKDEFFPPFVYKSIEMKGEVGVQYHLLIEADGKIVKSTTSIPDLPVINKILPVYLSDTTMQIDVQIENRYAEPEFYFAEIKVKGIDRNFHPSSFPLYKSNGESSDLSEYRIYRSDQPDPLGLYEKDSLRIIPEFEFYHTDTVFLKFSAIDLEAYNLLIDINLDNLNSGNPFSFINKKTNTNIIGGIGRWTGKATNNYIIYKQ